MAVAGPLGTPLGLAQRKRLALPRNDDMTPLVCLLQIRVGQQVPRCVSLKLLLPLLEKMSAFWIGWAEWLLQCQAEVEQGATS